MIEPLDLHGVLACRVVIGATFFLAVVGKLVNLNSFTRSVVVVSGVPARFSRLVTALLIIAEAGVVLSMASGGGLLRWAFGLVLGLLIAFTIVLLISLARVRKVSCNCFGLGSEPSVLYGIVRNVGLAGVTVLGFVLAGRSEPGDVASAEAAVTVIAGLMVVTVLVNLYDFKLILQRAPRSNSMGK